jgi:hypothetical protein
MVDELQGSERIPVNIVTPTPGDATSGANDQLVMDFVDKFRTSKPKWISDTIRKVRCSFSV